MTRAKRAFIALSRIGPLVLAASLLPGLLRGPDAAPRGAEPAAIIQLQDIPGAGKGLEASVNGHPALFLFDTGEGLSTLTPGFAQTMGCKPWGQTTGFRMSGERLDLPRCDDIHFGISGQTYIAPTAGVFDIMPLLPDSQTVLAGSLGLDIFAGRRITIEPASNRIIVESPGSFAERIRTAKAVPGRLVRDAEGAALAVAAAVPTRSGTAWMELDTGNGGTLVIGKHVAELLGLDPSQNGPQDARFYLAGNIPIEGSARVRDLIMDGNIGRSALAGWNLTLDLSTGQVWMAPAPQA
ncbi:MAG: aspartyl protease family protein [Caulobacteraceae bacterium]